MIATAALVLAGCGGDGSSGSSTSSGRAVTLRLDWLYGSEHTGYFVAKERGFFDECNIDVNIAEGQGSSTTVKVVGNGEDAFGVVAAGTVLTSIAKGVPVKTIGTVFEDTPTSIIHPTDSNINSLGDLSGKTLGILPKSVTFNEWQTVAKLNNIDRSSINEVGMDRSVVQALRSGRVDAAVAWFLNDGVQLRVQGMDVDFLRFSELGLEVPSSTLVVNKKVMEKSPSLVECFMSAVEEGWQYTRQKPEKALATFFEVAPSDPAKEFNRQKLPLVLDLMGSPGFTSDRESWGQLVDMYLQSGTIEEAPEMSQLYTNRFLPN